MHIKDISIDQLPAVAQQILQEFPDKKIFAFYGSIGSGKTSLIKELCKKMGVEGSVTSPTFSIVNEYRNTLQETIYHFDLYRLTKMEELLDIGFEEYISSPSICLIEWPEIAEDFLPYGYVKISIQEEENHLRSITLS